MVMDGEGALPEYGMSPAWQAEGLKRSSLLVEGDSMGRTLQCRTLLYGESPRAAVW